MKKTIGILAHVDAGKTTFAEQVLYYTKSIRNRGRVDHKDTFLDNHNIERERGITVFSEQAIYEYNNSKYYLIDTPGHMDFSSEMERAIKVMDYAVVIISAVEGVQAHTETVWNLLRNYKIPTIFFINKIDRVGANVEKVLEDIKIKLTKNSCYIKCDLKNENMDEELIEFIAESDEEVLVQYLDEGYNKELWLKSLKNNIKECNLYPSFAGSALQDIGIERFINNLDTLTYTNYNDEGEFKGRVYKVKHDENGSRVTYIKALSGVLKVKEELEYKCGEKRISEKINQIRVYNGNKFKTVEKVVAGEIFSVVGLSDASPGDGVGKLYEVANYEIVPTLKSKVIYDEKLNVKEVLNKFKILGAEDPSLNVLWDEALKEIHVHIIGIIQLEVLKEIFKERFTVNVDFGKCEVLYKETIEKEAYGIGHFEPLKHYAEVVFKLEPNKRNSGITFDSACHVDDLAINYQKLIKSHIFERKHKGVLTGSEITDVKITLLNGRSHIKHTEGGDFREATYRALRYGLEEANSILLEPYYKFKIDVSLDCMGRVLSDIQKLYGTFEEPEIIGEKVIIKGKGPVATFMDYYLELVSFTKGKGIISLRFDGYNTCHNAEEVIEKINYNKDADIEYTSTSIFCSKGQGFIVLKENVEEYMHCPIP